MNLSMIWVSTGDPPFDMGAILKCNECLDWQADIDGVSLPDVIRFAEAHIDDAVSAGLPGHVATP